MEGEKRRKINRDGRREKEIKKQRGKKRKGEKETEMKEEKRRKRNRDGRREKEKKK